MTQRYSISSITLNVIPLETVAYAETQILCKVILSVHFLGQLRKEATEAIETAVRATASSALALRLTDEALHEAAHNQTSTLLDVLSTVIENEAPSATPLSKIWGTDCSELILGS